jgi:hypothetical protein
MGSEAVFRSGTRDQRKHLRVAVCGTATLRTDGGLIDRACHALTVGSVVLEGDVGDAARGSWVLERLVIDGASFDLGVPLRLAEDTDEEPGAFVAEFVDMDGPTRAGVRTMFTYAVSKVLPPRPRASTVTRFEWTFRDARQVAEVCRVLLGRADLRGLWTDAGPTEAARALLSDARSLQPDQAITLKTAWRLWSGSLEVTRELADLPDNLASALGALDQAMTRGPTGIDRWLETEKR